MRFALWNASYTSHCRGASSNIYLNGKKCCTDQQPVVASTIVLLHKKRLNKEPKKYESTALSSQPITLNMTNYETLRNPVEKLSSGEKKNWRRASGQTGSASKSALATAARNLLAADEICFSQYLVNIAAEPAPTWGKKFAQTTRQ